MHSSVDLKKYKFILTEKENDIFKITINKVRTLNSLCFESLREISDAVRTSNECKDTKYTVITANGKYFCAGMDFKQYFEWKTEGIIANQESMKKDFAEFVNCFLYHDKPLIGALNGPSIGGGVAMVTYFDYTIASEDTSIVLPFTKFGLTPTDLISYRLPLILGMLKANEMLLLGKPLTAKEAYDLKLFNEVVKKENLWKSVIKVVNQFNKAKIEDIIAVKKMIRYNERQIIQDWSNREIESFVEGLCKPEFYESISKYKKS
ncbi:Enoyl-CoA delta isomerase 2, mitochondrial [Strongyloides ratti]|uniref:Enoyl-CoA delta isomerase 2, mitochondrial n=1 Tax=Strongyloides ratti TaxID=34506 RepID=A0A090MZG6_STRRB|nr:Enoyl-CoA delta isomerase 2, mitochondrial [Strongyloides ratti]CEF68899.1 Enoyl-CoA delta isomerase 2, mitochondrial [Strongyloides ratti]